MSFSSNLYTPPVLKPATPGPILFPKPSFRIYKRRKFKSKRSLSIQNNLFSSTPFDNLFHNLITQIPSFNSLELITPALGFASGVALYFSRLGYGKSLRQVSDIGEWVLFTSPTPFNRFVLLRCPSISFEGDDSDEKLVKEDRHFVRLNSGRIQSRDGDDCKKGVLKEELEYQRVCVSTQDGGVISLDWPVNLVLEEEHGLDTTVLLVPGTVEGSMDKNVRQFVCQALQCGLFPVVMNPRGCAGSPLTTARLFTAADSDDIFTAVQFINKERPWTTLMSVGWGYGANMLTKYLAEAGEQTPLTAATCIDNPFDLDEATRPSPYNVALDQKFTSGLISILQSNKEIFKGRAKRFDVEKALGAKSLRDFERAISMVSYGFETIEDFYAKSNTRDVIGKMKIPVLFIQSDDGIVPPYTVPHSLIAKNPFTSLLLCSSSPLNLTADDRSAISWCQDLAIEWLEAVELGLLKGRHPLLKDVDFNINLSEGLIHGDARASKRSGELSKFLELPQENGKNGYSVAPVKEATGEGDSASSLQLGFERGSYKKLDSETEVLQKVDNVTSKQKNITVDAELIKGEITDPENDERGQVLQAAQVVMNMLDMAMPGTLTEEEKRKVLTAVDEGQTIMKALQDALPEDVREKITSAVSGILHTQGSNINFEGLLPIGQIPKVSSELKSKIQEKVKGVSNREASNNDSYSPEKVDSNLSGNSNHSQSSITKSASGPEAEPIPSEQSQKSVDRGQTQSISNQGDNNLASVKRVPDESGNNHESNGSSRVKDSSSSDVSDKEPEPNAKERFSTQSEKTGSTEDATSDELNVDQDQRVAPLDSNENQSIQKNEDSSHNSSTDGNKSRDSSTDQNKSASTSNTEEAPSSVGSPSEGQPTEDESNDTEKRDNKNVRPAVEQNKSLTPDSRPPGFSVSQAFDALTGIDDSTQVAVNSVFGVIESMIAHFEEGNNAENEDGDKVKAKMEINNSVSIEQRAIDDPEPKEEKVDPEGGSSVQSDKWQDPPTDNHHESIQYGKSSGWEEKDPKQNPNSSDWNELSGSLENDSRRSADEDKTEKNGHFVGNNILADNSERAKHVNNVPVHMVENEFMDSVYSQDFCRNLLLTMSKTKSLDIDTTTALLLDYFPEEGQWKLLEQSASPGDSDGEHSTQNDINGTTQANVSAKENSADNILEPLYVIFDSEKDQEPHREYEINNMSDNGTDSDCLEELMLYVKNIILDTLKIEVSRRSSAADVKEMTSSLARDAEKVANAVSLAVKHDNENILLEAMDDDIDRNFEKVGTLRGESIIRAISSAVQETSSLRKLIPVGVIVGSSLAALRKHFNITILHDTGKREFMTLNHQKRIKEKNQSKGSVAKLNQIPVSRPGREKKKPGTRTLNREGAMVGAVTAALGASALLVQQQDTSNANATAESSQNLLKEKGKQCKEPEKLDEVESEKNHNIVTSLAEKAMSVAGPVVPTKEDGGVDQERLVAMLTDLGQKGGILKLVGKLALLWSGIRGAMSLTDRLIGFLRIAERPLLQRILGFIGMVLVLWSPVVVPLLPTLVQSWTTKTSARVAELACIFGLYAAVMILIVLWGKRIRGYNNPLKQYGLDLTSKPKIIKFSKGLVGGIMLVLAIHSMNLFFGCINFSMPSSYYSSSLDAWMRLKAFGHMLMLACQGVLVASSVALVEELVFRSWLLEEIAADIGYQRGIILSGFAFSLSQRSPLAIPGLWLLSLALAGARQRSQGDLAVPVGLRAGILASSYVVQHGGFLVYKQKFPIWVTGNNPFEPFSGVAGLAFSLLMAIILYPREPFHKKKLKRAIRKRATTGKCLSGRSGGESER